MKYFSILLFFLCASVVTQSQETPVQPLPSAAQLAWQNNEFYLFMHFGPNTFTDLEWGKGSEQEEIFNPTKLDCNQWCSIAKAAGAKGIIITAKHHDGFCLWPSKFSAHTVAQSKWKDGKGDVLKELSDACKKYDLKFGVYLSPWDRNHPAYGTEEYNEVFINMMKEVIQHYGPMFEFWWDGANGEGPGGKKQQYDWKRFEATLRTIAPNTCVFSDIGPDIRWTGNESGTASLTNWNLLDTARFARGAGAPPADTLNGGNKFGKNWIPSECDVSIRPGWFYHENENEKIKTAAELFSLYLKSVGRGSSLLLNVPPDRNGLISKYDSASLMNFKRNLDESFKKNLAKNATLHYKFNNIQQSSTLLTDNNITSYIASSLADSPNITISFLKEENINCIMLSEPLQMGQRISSFSILLINNNKVIKKITATTIGHKRIITFPGTMVQSVEIKINESKAIPLISEIAIYNIPENFVENE